MVVAQQRRSTISKTTLIGDSQIPATLGQTITGALANIPFPFGIDPDTGEYGYRKAGADTVTPFKSLVQESINTSMYSMRLPCLRNGYTLIDGVISQTGTTLPPCMPIAGFNKIKVRIGSSARPLYYVFTKPDGTQYGQSIGGRQAISSTSETTIDIPTGATIWWYILTISTANQDVDNIGLSLVV